MISKKDSNFNVTALDLTLNSTIQYLNKKIFIICKYLLIFYLVRTKDFLYFISIFVN